MIHDTQLGKMLLYDLSSVQERLFLILKTETLAILPAIILISALITPFFGMDFGGIIKRAFLAVACVALFQWYFIGCATLGFELGGALLSPDNHITKTWMKAATLRKTGSVMGSMPATEKKSDVSGNMSYFTDNAVFKKAKQWGEDFTGFFMWTISNLALWFVTASFTLAFYMPLILVPVVVLVNIMPFTSKAVDGLFFTSIWIAVTPVVITVLLEIINAMLIDDNILANASFMVKTILNIIFSVYLVGSFSLGWKLLGQTGISAGISQIGQSVGTGIVMAGLMWASNSARRLGSRAIFGGGGSPSLFQRTLSPFKNQKSKAYQRAQNIMDGNAIKATDVMDKATPNYSARERKALALNKALNPVKAARDGLDRRKAASNAIAGREPSKVIDRKAINEMRSQENRAPIAQDGKSYGQKGRVSRDDWSNEKNNARKQTQKRQSSVSFRLASVTTDHISCNALPTDRLAIPS
jgi:hypothetical protein